MKLRILIDATPLARRTDGLAQYIKNIVLNLDSQKFDYTLLVRPNECDDSFLKQVQHNGIATEQAQIAPIGPLRDWQFRRFYRRNKSRFDTALFLSNQFPIFTHWPSAYVVHDLIYEEFPQQLGRLAWLKQLYLHFVVAQGLKKSSEVIAVSNYTKSDIQKWHKSVQTNKINVVYEGWEHLQHNDTTTVNLPLFFANYFIYVGSSRGHKNIDRLLDAIDLAQAQLPADFGFVCVGSMQHLTSEQRRKIERINTVRTLIKFTDWLSENELAYYMQHAKALIFPSLSEGFGIPVLEAFYYKLPLLLANRTSLPEVAGDAAIYFNPFDASELSEKIVSLATQKIDGQIYVERGNQRIAQFSWKTSATEIEKILVKVCNKNAK